MPIVRYFKLKAELANFQKNHIDPVRLNGRHIRDKGSELVLEFLDFLHRGIPGQSEHQPDPSQLPQSEIVDYAIGQRGVGQDGIQRRAQLGGAEANFRNDALLAADQQPVPNPEGAVEEQQQGAKEVFEGFLGGEENAQPDNPQASEEAAQRFSRAEIPYQVGDRDKNQHQIEYLVGEGDEDVGYASVFSRAPGCLLGLGCLINLPTIATHTRLS